MEARERLYRLVEQVPDGEIHAAERNLEYLVKQGDPLVRALMHAPASDEPLSDEDRKALEEGRRALDDGDVVSDEELRAELGI
jgi:hypothetical protein